MDFEKKNPDSIFLGELLKQRDGKTLSFRWLFSEFLVVYPMPKWQLQHLDMVLLVKADSSGSVISQALLEVRKLVCLCVLNVLFRFCTLTGQGTLSTTGSHKEQRWWLGQSQRFERQPKIQAEISDEVHLLYKTNLLRLGEVAVLSNARNQYREWRKIRNKRICSKEKNEINCQKLILMK